MISEVCQLCLCQDLRKPLREVLLLVFQSQVFPAFIVKHLPVGLVGIIVAAVFSAAMSTLSSSLNSSAAAAVNDFYLPWRRQKPSPGHLLWVSRGLTIVFGLVQIGVGIVGQLLDESVVVSVLAIAGFGVYALLKLRSRPRGVDEEGEA